MLTTEPLVDRLYRRKDKIMKQRKWESNADGGGVFITMSDESQVYVAAALGATKHIRVTRARLIAAAPETAAQRDDLLAACKDARKWFEDYIECKPRPNEQSAIDMQHTLHESIVQTAK